jgi:signal transduction histidine kinase/CheY-like chemotaxis protein
LPAQQPAGAGEGAQSHEALHRQIAAAANGLDEMRQRWLNPPEGIEPIAKAIDAKDDFADVPAGARPLIRQSAIMAAGAQDPNLKKRTLTNLYGERPTWLRPAHRKLDETVLAVYPAIDPEGDGLLTGVMPGSTPAPASRFPATIAFAPAARRSTRGCWPTCRDGTWPGVHPGHRDTTVSSLLDAAALAPLVKRASAGADTADASAKGRTRGSEMRRSRVVRWRRILPSTGSGDTPTRDGGDSHGQPHAAAPPDRPPSESLLRLAWRIARPVALTVGAALAFAALLHRHHSQFLDGLVSKVQSYQLTTAQDLSAFLQKSMDDMDHSLELLASSPELSGNPPGIQQALDAYYKRNSDILDQVAVDAHDATVLALAPPAGTDDAQPLTQPGAAVSRPSPAAAFAASAGAITVVIPITGIHPPRQLRASVSIYRLCGRSFSRSEGGRNTIRSLITEEGQAILDSSGILLDSHVVNHQRRPGDRPERLDVPALPYLASQCARNGQTGLAEMTGRAKSQDYLVAYAPVIMQGRRYALVVSSPKSDVTVPLSSHTRLTYALMLLLTMLYFAVGYMAYRSEMAQIRLERQRRQSAEEASRAKSEFLARMSHELRTPMNGIIGMADLASQTADPDKQRHYLEVLKRSADSLLVGINDVLDFSRIEAGKLDLCLMPFELDQCLSTCLAPLENLACRKGLSFQMDVAPDVPARVVGDPGRLRQVITNLVGNAIKFTQNGQVGLKVTVVSAESNHVMLHFAVQDTGPGIVPEDQARIFQAFEQGDPYQVRRHGGSGLGLAICRQLVELMGGTIGVQSDAGRGSTFHFTARFGLESAAAAEDSHEEMLPQHMNQVLLISGIKEHREHLEGLLRGWGLTVITAQSAATLDQALVDARHSQASFQLVFFDATIDDLDAFSTTRWLRQQGQCSEAVIAIYSRAGLRGDAGRCRSEGADVYLAGPIDEPTFRRVIGSAYRNRQDRLAPVPLTRHDAQASVRKLAVLLVEDNPVNQEVAKTILESWGHRVVLASSGAEALAVYPAQPCDLILMDVQMPEMDGLETTARLRKAEKAVGKRVPIIAMTAHARDCDRQACLRADMDGYVCKPVRPEVLQLAIGRTLAKCEARAKRQDLRPLEPCDQEDVWNLQTAMRYVGGNKMLLMRAIGRYLEQEEERLRCVGLAVAQQQWQPLKEWAHSLKNTLGVLGAVQAHKLAIAVDDLCSQENYEAAAGGFGRLQERLGELRGRLKAWLEENQHASVSS